MSNSVSNDPHNNKPAWWLRLISFVVTIIVTYSLAFDTIPSLIRHDIHKLPYAFWELSILFLSFGKWYVWNTCELFADILLAAMLVSLLASMISGTILGGMNIKYTPPLFISMVFLIIIAVGVIWDRRSPDKTDDQEPVSGERTKDE